MELMQPLDAAFLLAESREHPMHVGALMLFEPPADAGPEYVRGVYERMVADVNYHPTYLKRPVSPIGNVSTWAWAQDDEIDVEYHIRRVAMPSPGRIRELLSVVSRWHGTLLDRHRPLWEAHIIEGLADGRFAVYMKVHHALMDGVSALRHLERRMSTDPNADDCPAFWARRDAPARTAARKSPVSPLRAVLDGGAKVASGLAELVPDAVRIGQKAIGDKDLVLPGTAPKTMLNVPIGGARRFAAQSWEIKRINAVRDAAGVSVNDVVLAMCAGALRIYLAEHDGLPDRSLNAFVPISTRAADKDEALGNAVGVILCRLGTEIADPKERLAVISASMNSGKDLYRSVGPISGLAWTLAALSPMLAAPVPGALSIAPQSFNVIVSNVPGPRQPMYWNGAKLTGMYPVSVVAEGQALNITLTNNDENLDFGLIGCRRSVPHLQHILTHLETALQELEAAYA
ncbi:wax ester/triacylglycerol synthase family O-acyltransferase [Skermania sp. ID1734]|uniref:WS/DGAT/MGAT family O-acyltransferase n=1 Tax=Skermania sp. ID1734 TaxID=2597516 RepID=UPI00117E90AA|nr:wax ester/triacylglycerol synthase family O-acyltransferase [Skermania sp. ID1734]TSD99822.1 wax ester/triacylglycerol synthase family O-acyltransferase [Skermania sp. ID1734]